MEKEEQYKVFFENAAEAIVVLDMDLQKFVSVSKSALELFRMSEDELLQLGVAEVSPEYQPDGRRSSEIAMEELVMAIEGGKIYNMNEINLGERDASGTYTIFDDGAPLNDASGNPFTFNGKRIIDDGSIQIPTGGRDFFFFGINHFY